MDEDPLIQYFLTITHFPIPISLCSDHRPTQETEEYKYLEVITNYIGLFDCRILINLS